MKVIVELEDSRDSNCSHLELQLAEELGLLLAPKGFSLKQLTVVEAQKKPPDAAAAVPISDLG